MIGPEVTELVQGFVIAMTLGATGVDLIDYVFPHPTLFEVMPRRSWRTVAHVQRRGAERR